MRLLAPPLALLASASWASLAAAQWSASPSIDTPVCIAANAQVAPRAVPDGAGGLIVIWQDPRGAPGAPDIYAQRLNGPGFAQWTANGVVVCSAAGAQSKPAAVADGAGGVIVAWSDRRGADSDVYAQRLGSNGAPQWTPNGVALCTQAGDQQDVTVVSDGAGGAIVAWRDSRSAPSAIYTQRIVAGGTTSWTAQGVLVASDVVDLGEPLAVADGSSGAIVVWHSQLAQQLWARRISAAGALQWGAASALGANIASSPQKRVASDGAGGALATWVDIGDDVWAQRVSGAGAVQWGALGREVCAAAGAQSGPSIATDGAAGAFIAWEDQRVAGTTHVYAQRLNAAGTPLLAPNGQELCLVSLTQRSPVLAPSSSGGAIVVWKDSRVGLWGQRLDASGAPQWGDPGVAIARQAPGQQSDVQIVPEAVGGAFLAFTNGSADLDVYAKRVNVAGGLTVGVGDDPVAAESIALGAIAPNPLSARSVVRMTLAREASVDLAAFDAAGRRVATLAAGRWSAGAHDLPLRSDTWAPGVYFVRLRADGLTLARRAAKLE